MNKSLPGAFIAVVCLLAIMGASCKKGVKEPVTLDKAAGTWSINAVRFSAFYGSGTSKDSTIPWKPIIGNNVRFDGVSNMEYCFNLPYKNFGTYQLNAGDSITISFVKDNNRLEGIDYWVKAFGGETTKWKIRLLTATNFNIEKTVDQHIAFPGASTVIMYQNFVR
ncbi:MAG TPA: hypothetical protein PKC39_09755 [Ferruginibacter sp.]|nr:hypothetical protein [Ferruginibacter sp.]HMP21232.1 hypothetical protein [Ferruginibacter sp.]